MVALVCPLVPYKPRQRRYTPERPPEPRWTRDLRVERTNSQSDAKVWLHCFGIKLLQTTANAEKIDFQRRDLPLASQTYLIARRAAFRVRASVEMMFTLTGAVHK